MCMQQEFAPPLHSMFCTWRCHLYIILLFALQCWEDREWRDSISKNNAKGLTTLRQKLRKYCRDFETEMAKYREVGADFFMSCDFVCNHTHANTHVHTVRSHPQTKSEVGCYRCMLHGLDLNSCHELFLSLSHTHTHTHTTHTSKHSSHIPTQGM